MHLTVLFVLVVHMTKLVSAENITDIEDMLMGNNSDTSGEQRLSDEPRLSGEQRLYLIAVFTIFVGAICIWRLVRKYDRRYATISSFSQYLHSESDDEEDDDEVVEMMLYENPSFVL